MSDFSGVSKKEEDKLEQMVILALLYDFYGALLKPRKRLIFEDFILNDLSLGEIALDRGISRQGVHDIVKRCTKELNEYEEKLCLIKKFKLIKHKVNTIHQIARELRKENETGLEGINEIENLSNEILDEF